MRKYLSTVVVAVCLLTSGCAAAIVGAGGTALWQHGKIVSEEPRQKTDVDAAVQTALKSKKIEITDDVGRDNFSQVRGLTPDGRKVAVDIIGLTKNSCRIEIRVGLGERAAAKDLLLEVKKNLYEKPGLKLF